MERNRDIYKAPEAESKDEGNLAAVDFVPAEHQARTRRATIGAAVLMLVILAVAWWWVASQDRRDEEHRQAVTGAVGAVEGEFRPTPPALNAVPPTPPDLPEVLSRTIGQTLGELDREKMAEAVGEVRIANQYLEAKEWDGAELHARKALEIWPNMNEAERLLGFLYTQRGQFDQAIAMLEKSLESRPFSAETFNNLATAYMQRWEFEKAKELLITCLEIRPDFYIAHVNLGMLYVVTGQYELTIDHLQRALELAPDNVSARNNLAVAMLRVGRYRESRAHLQHIIGRLPGRASAYFNIAITHILERDFSTALDWIYKGSQLCSPLACRNYLADSDFDPIRGHPAFQQLLNNLYPELPKLPED